MPDGLLSLSNSSRNAQARARRGAVSQARRAPRIRSPGGTSARRSIASAAAALPAPQPAPQVVGTTAAPRVATPPRHTDASRPAWSDLDYVRAGAVTAFLIAAAPFFWAPPLWVWALVAPRTDDRRHRHQVQAGNGFCPAP